MFSVEDIKHVGVVGAGTMGAGIAQVSAQSGYEVVLFDVDEGIVQKSVEQIAYYINRLAEKGRITEEDAQAAVGRIMPTTSYHSFRDCHVVIEAAPENIDIKREIFEKLEDVTDDQAILATNTSTLSVTQIGAGVQFAGRVVGMHFFNPAPLMPLVEVIGGVETDEQVMDTVIALAGAMGKTPVRVTDSPGFIVNRVARPFYLEGLRMLEQGIADHATIDRLVKSGGFRMGPFELMDLVGIDINYAASKNVYEAYFHLPRFRPSIRQQQKAASGNLGRKTGKGWYTYEEEN